MSDIHVFDEVIGKVVLDIRETKINDNDSLVFNLEGEHWIMTHEQDCCESVWLEDINGDLYSMLGERITIFEEVSENHDGECGDSVTWTFYKIGTKNEIIILRWIGQSNGYYSESVNFYMDTHGRFK